MITARSREAIASARFGVIWTNYSPLVRFISQTERLEQFHLGPARAEFGYESGTIFLAFAYLPCLAIAVALATCVFVSGPLRRRLGLRAALVLFFVLVQFGTCFEIAIVHSLENHRYDRMQLIFTLLAQAATFLLTVEFALETRALLRAARTATARAES